MSEGRIREDVEELCGFDGRLPGTDAERRACNHVAERLRASGRRAMVEPTYVQPQWALVHLLTCLLAVIGSAIAQAQPLAGFLCVLLAATSAYLDLSARLYLIRRIPFRRASQNVHTLPAEPSGPTVLLCANADAPRTGLIYARTGARIANRLGRRFPVVSSGTRIWFWSIALLLPPLGVRLAGLDPGWLAALQLPQTLVLIIACFLLGEIALSPASPGANANASGVAAVLDVLRRIDADPPENLRVEAVIAGAGESTEQGMRAFVRAHRKELAKEETWFISFESVGRGEPRFVATLPPSWELTAHVLLSMGAAALLFGAAVTAILSFLLDRRLRKRRIADLPTSLPPLDELERIMFRLVGAGFALLTLALFTGLVFVTDLFAQHLIHKTVLSVIAWVLFGVLLVGRARFGWRGRTAVRWTLIGFVVLALAYFGSKFVLETVLGRHWG